MRMLDERPEQQPTRSPESYRPECSLTVRRVFAATPERLYAAWTDLETMRGWMGSKVEADVRPGGRYRREAETAEGALFVHFGEYQVLEPTHRIVQTFGLEGIEENPFRDEQVEVVLRPIGDTE